MMVMLLAAIDQTIVSSAMPTIGRELSDIEHLPRIVTSYLFSSAVVTPYYGKLADIIGRRTTIITATVIFLAGLALARSKKVSRFRIWRPSLASSLPQKAGMSGISQNHYLRQMDSQSF